MRIHFLWHKYINVDLSVKWSYSPCVIDTYIGKFIPQLVVKFMWYSRNKCDCKCDTVSYNVYVLVVCILVFVRYCATLF